MRVFSKTDIGLRRNSNEDYCKEGTFSDGSIWAVVCDGMGGANGGCTASSVSAETIASSLIENYQESMSGEQIYGLIDDAIDKANLAVYNMARNVASLYGMGTTVVCAVVKDGMAHVVHAGDSRAYLYNGQTLKQITTDHSMVQEMVDAGHITPEQALHHPQRNFITRALGIEPELRTDYNVADFGQGYKLILCTDGLSNYIDNQKMLAFAQNDNGEVMVNELVETAKELGGSDNITVVVIAD